MASDADKLSDMDVHILREFRANARVTMTEISRTSKIPVSTIFDRLKEMEAKGVIRRYTCLPDWKRLGLSVQMLMLVKSRRVALPKIEEWMKASPRVNNLVRVNGDFCLVAEALFENVAELEGFIEGFKKGFIGAEIRLLYVLEDLKREGVMCGKLSEKKGSG